MILSDSNFLFGDKLQLHPLQSNTTGQKDLEYEKLTIEVSAKLIDEYISNSSPDFEGYHKLEHLDKLIGTV